MSHTYLYLIWISRRQLLCSGSSHKDPYPDAHVYPYPNSYFYAYPDLYTYVYPYQYAHARADCDSYSRSNAYRQSYCQCNPNS
jgi:hypothetical protein